MRRARPLPIARTSTTPYVIALISIERFPAWVAGVMASPESVSSMVVPPNRRACARP